MTAWNTSYGKFWSIRNKSGRRVVIIAVWKRDSCGCEHLRSVAMADSIISNLHLIGEPIEKVRNFLGKENEVATEDDGTIHLFYFVKSICDSDGTVVGDKSIIELIVSSDGKLMEFPDWMRIE